VVEVGALGTLVNLAKMADVAVEHHLKWQRVVPEAKGITVVLVIILHHIALEVVVEVVLLGRMGHLQNQEMVVLVYIIQVMMGLLAIRPGILAEAEAEVF
jgi:uncharacterized membrane protein